MGLFAALVRTAVNTALLPVAIVKDALTLGGATSGRGSYTSEAIDRIKEEADDEPTND